jgi:hypothetical protein
MASSSSSELEKLNEEYTAAKANRDEQTRLLNLAVVGSAEREAFEKQQAHFQRDLERISLRISEEKKLLGEFLSSFLLC